MTAAGKPVLYRWECAKHRQHGRWLKDGNLAQVFGSNHEARYSTGPYGERPTCDPRVKDGTGRDHGRAS